jgi:ParB-like chromosome segregation protein Spo0J
LAANIFGDGDRPMNDLRDPFNPKTGVFSDNIRVKGEDDLSELCELMKQWGWKKHLPAFVDEHDVVIVGHRRLKVAKELGIEPVIVKLTFGKGEAADAERLKLALASNLGAKGLSKDDRKHIAKQLYGTGEWTMERIAEALNVVHSTIVKDLKGVCSPEQTSRPKGGRPKGSGTKANRSGPQPQHRKNTPAVEETTASLVLDQGKTYEQTKAELGLSSVHIVKTAVAREEGRRQAQPEITPDMLSMTQQKKNEIWRRQEMHRMAMQFHRMVNDKVREFLEDTILPRHRKEQEEAKRVMNARRGIMDKATFNKIRRGLHPDSRNSISDKMLAEAFDAFMGLEKLLLNEKDSPTTFGKLPDNMAEWEKMKMKAKAERAAKRASGRSAIRRR